MASIPTTRDVNRGLVPANGTELYCEVRGQGPSVLFIQGATGDAGFFEKIADVLADEFRVITFDRRGNSRSPRQDGWVTTSISEQADDAAALLRELDANPAVVFGTSGGGVILTDLVSRHPEAVLGAIVHEPALISVLPDPEVVMSGLQAMAAQAMAQGGPSAALAAFLRHYAGSDNFDAMDPSFRARILGNAEIFFGAEMEAFVGEVPDVDAMKKTGVPIVAALGEESSARHPEIAGAIEWMVARLGSDLVKVPGAHVGYYDHADQFAATLRPVVRKIAQRLQ